MLYKFCCKNCCKEVEKNITPYQSKRIEFCSNVCANIYNGHKRNTTKLYKIICKNCLKEFEIISSASKKNRKFCSNKCLCTYNAQHRPKKGRIYKFTCKNCLKETETYLMPSREGKTFCSKRCLCQYVASHPTEETRKKMSLAKIKPQRKCKCKECGNVFITKKKKKMFCSNTCSARYRCKNPNYRKRLSKKAKKGWKEGRRKGWMNRKNLAPSHPEIVTMEILDKLNVKYEREHRVGAGRWFIDFAFLDKKIALEIDGKQHNMPERKKSDKRKDAHLRKNGWIVHRIRWKKISKEFYAELCKEIMQLLQINTNQLILNQ